MKSFNELDERIFVHTAIEEITMDITNTAATHYKQGNMLAAEDDLKQIEKASVEVLRLLDERMTNLD